MLGFSGSSLWFQFWVIDGWGVRVLSLLPNEKMLILQRVKISLSGHNDNPMKYRYPFMGFSLHFHQFW